MKHYLDFINNFFENNFENRYNKIIERSKVSNNLDISGLEISSFSILAKNLYEDINKNILLLSSENRFSEKLRDNLDFQFQEDNVSFLPEDISKNEHVYSQQNDSFFFNDCKNKLYDDNRYIYLTTLSGLDILFPNKEEFNKNSVLIEQGMEIGRDFMVDYLLNYGFQREENTTFPEEFSVKGSIVDLYIPGFSFPYRIEFFGDRIESIRKFNPENQLTIEKITSFKLFPIKDDDSNKSNILDILSEQNTLLLKFDSNELDNTEEFLSNNIPEINHYRYITKDIDFPIFNINITNKSVKGLKDYINREGGSSSSFDIFSSVDKQIERLNSIFEDSNIDIHKGYFTDSFYIKDQNQYVISENDFFSHSYKTRMTNKKLPSDIDVENVDIKDVSKGDLMVHVDYGIGEFQGLEKVFAFGVEKECLKLKYKKGDSIYVPLEKLNQVKEYRNSGKKPPSLTNLNSSEWEKKKAKTRESAEEIVEELITLYSIRENSEGYQYSSDDDLQIEMESEFPYQETPGQIKATRDIKKDMESPKPMDRLLCGDVGFGKTEVAMRAAFKAVLDSKQVAVLVPTTILAEQHYESFQERLNNYPVIIKQLSRFISRSKQKKILEELKSGNVDIIIGTHRLLSDDIKFDDLGLLIIDEEHRFGVKSKNKIKNYKKNLDVLSLSATPIPRTLQFSLIGARDFSLLKNPPKYRLPIVTEIINFDDDFIKNRINYELNRNGQIYFVHNEVKTIKTFTTKLHSIVPNATIEYAHGQMNESKLENVVKRFIDKEVDILVTTTIIESGIDIPNVNTMFINKANQFGLAQLYQLRGRVGRSNKRAFCYLIAPKMKKLNDDAVKRLKTIKRYTSLGSGYNIALSDMQIRGAGNLFGVEQSGNIQRIGYDLYVNILQEQFEEKKDEINKSLKIEEPDKSLDISDIKVISPYSNYINDDYINSEKIRLDFYRRISDCSDFEQLKEIKEELRDRFGKLPQETSNLFLLTKLKIYGARNSIEKFIIKENKSEFSFKKDEVKDHINNLLIIIKNICNKYDISYKFNPSEGLGVILYLQENSLEQILNLLDELDRKLNINN